MATVTNRESLAKYILEELGSPVININVSDEQISNAIDNAIQYFIEYAYDGTQVTYIASEINQTVLNNGYITIPSDIISIDNVTLTKFSTSDVNANNLFSMFNDITGEMRSDAISRDLAYYEITYQHLQDIINFFSASPRYEFNRVLSRLFLNLNFNSMLGQSVILECKKISGNTSKFYNSIILKELATQFLKRAWGNNLKKFNSVSLPGGAQIDGATIYNEANETITLKLEELRKNYELPPMFFMA